MRLVRFTKRGKWHAVDHARTTVCGRSYRPHLCEFKDAIRKDEIFYADRCSQCLE